METEVISRYNPSSPGRVQACSPAIPASRIINKINITPEAVFDYEHCLFAREAPIWGECLTAVGCDWQAELLKAGYDRRTVYKQCGCVWKKCLCDAGGDIPKARLAMAEAVNYAEAVLKKRWTAAFENTAENQCKAFEYAERFEAPAVRFDKTDLKHEAEEYIDLQNRDGRLLYDNYFRCKYFDEKTGRMLMLFLYRDIKIGLMQYWNLAGICFCEDWTEYDEEDGKIRHWLKGKITDLDKGDWVAGQQARADADKLIGGEYAIKGTITGVPKEVKDAFENGNSKGIAEAVSFCEAASGSRVRRSKIARKGAIS